MTQNTMQAAAIDSFGGGPDSITPHDLPVPQIDADEILVRVLAAGVGAWDPFEAEGGFAKIMGTTPHFPYVLGTDGAGTVEEVGGSVQGFKKGDKVYGISLAGPKGGFYAQYAAVKAKDASQIPSGLSMEQAGVFPVDAITALQGLETVQLRAGESIMIYGASGGIGHLAVQLAKAMGANVFAVASGADGVAMVRGLRADAVVDGRKDDVLAAARRFTPEGIDCALVTAGGEETDHVLDAIRDGGRVAYPNGVEPTPKTRSSVSCRSYDGMPTPEMIHKLNELVEKEPFEVHIAKIFTLDQAAEAHKALNMHYLGKLALKPSGG